MRKTISIKKVKSTKCPRINFKPKLDQARIGNALSLLNPEKYQEVANRLRGYNSEFTSDDVPYLIGAIKDEWNGGLFAISALEKLCDPRALEPVIEFFEKATTGPDIATGCDALVKLGDPKALNSILRKMDELKVWEFFEKRPSKEETNMDSNVRDYKLLLYSAAKLGSKRAMELLCDLMDYHLFRVQQGPIVLALMKGLKFTKSEKAIQTIINFDPRSVDSEDSYVLRKTRLDYSFALYNIKDERAVQKLISFWIGLFPGYRGIHQQLLEPFARLYTQFFQDHFEMFNKLDQEEIEQIMEFIEEGFSDSLMSYSNPTNEERLKAFEEFIDFCYGFFVHYNSSFNKDEKRDLLNIIGDLWRSEKEKAQEFISLLNSLTKEKSSENLNRLMDLVYYFELNRFAVTVILPKIVDLYLSSVDSLDLGSLSQIQEHISKIVQLDLEHVMTYSKKIFGKLNYDQFGTLMLRVKSEDLVEELGRKLFGKSEDEWD